MNNPAFSSTAKTAVESDRVQQLEQLLAALEAGAHEAAAPASAPGVGAP